MKKFIIAGSIALASVAVQAKDMRESIAKKLKSTVAAAAAASNAASATRNAPRSRVVIPRFGMILLRPRLRCYSNTE